MKNNNKPVDVRYESKSPQPNIIQISASDHRMTALGDNGKAYYFSQGCTWEEYPLLPKNNE